MPALFAYLIAMGLLLGGGYGALNGLAAPEPIKAAAKAKPKPPPRYAASPEASPSEPNFLSINDGDHATSDTNIHSPSPRARMEASEQGTRAMPLTPPQDEQSRSADKVFSPPEPKQHAEVSPVNDATQGAAHPAQAASSTSANKQPASASTAAAAPPKPVKRTLRQASRHFEKPALALMTLRTIEFPDGRRATQLIPYRGEHALGAD
jgi:hypothetical protein